MSQLSVQRKFTEYSEAFITNPEDIKLKDKSCPTKLECNVVRKKLTENLQGITCTDDRLIPMGSSAIIIKEEKYKKYRVKSYNRKVKKRALIEAKAAKDASDNLTEDHKEVKAIWEKEITNENSPKEQLPTFEIRTQFVIDDKWSDKRTN